MKTSPRVAKAVGSEQADGIRPCLLLVMQRRDVGLAAIACCADLVAADARFNLRILQVEKESASEERFFQLIEDYDRVSIECVHAVDVFDANGDTNALAQSLTELARELEAFIAGS